MPNDVCDKRAAGRETARAGGEANVSLNMENIFFNGFLMTPMELAEFVDSFKATAFVSTSTPATS